MNEIKNTFSLFSKMNLSVDDMIYIIPYIKYSQFLYIYDN